MQFEEMYDCEINYQYLFDGKQKKYYPVITNLSLSDDILDLDEFSTYPIITFHSCIFENVTIKSERLRDLNFQECEVTFLNLEIEEFNGTLGFANSTVSLRSIRTKSTPQIFAMVESVLIGLKEPYLQGFDLHTLAIMSSSLDYLDLDPFIVQLEMKQLILSDLAPSMPFKISIPKDLESLKIKNIQLHRLPELGDDLHLQSIHLEGLDILSYHHDLQLLGNLRNLEELLINRATIKYLPDFNLNNLEHLSLDKSIEIDEKLQARLKFAGLRVHLLD